MQTKLTRVRLLLLAAQELRRAVQAGKLFGGAFWVCASPNVLCFYYVLFICIMIIITTIVVEMCFGGFGELVAFVSHIPTGNHIENLQCFSTVSEALHLEAMFFSKHVTLRE